MSVKSCKYIYKYVHKGGDRAMFDLSTAEGRQQRDADRAARRDEINYFQDNRSVGACEAVWRIYGFDMADMYPSVLPLPVHLENGQRPVVRTSKSFLPVLTISHMAAAGRLFHPEEGMGSRQ